MGHLADSIALQLGQGLSGTFADYLALLLVCLGIAAALSRALDIFPIIKHLRFLLTAQALTLSSVALWTNGDHISLHHQHLTMFFFLVSMFLRFSGSSEHPKAAASLYSLIKRWFSRLGEYAILTFALPSFQSIAARPQYVVPLLIFVATARTNEVFRAWSGPASDGGKRSPSEEDQMRKALDELVPHTGNIVGGLHHPLQLEEQQKALYQLGFLWIDSSGTLVIAALTVLMVSIVSMAGYSDSLHNSARRWLTICVEGLYVIAAVYLCLQCLPAWIICLEKFGVLVKEDQGQAEWLGEVKGWTSDMARFLKTITVSGGFAFKCKDLPTKLGIFFAFMEGMELAPHVVVAALCRILLHSLLLLIAWIVRKLFRLCELLSRMRLLSKLLNLLMADSPYDPWVKPRHFLWKFAATICRQELLILKALFQDPPSFILIGVEFIQRDEYSRILFSKRLHGSFRIPRNACSTVVRKIMDGYCWVEAEGRIGYAGMEGTFVRVPFKEIGKENWGVVGGWITDEADVKSHEWGDSSEDNSENVGHFFANLNYDALFQGQSAATLKVWFKFGPKAIRMSHWWVNDKSILAACTCEPPLHDPINVKVLATHLTTWPAMSTCKLSLVNESLI